VREGGGLTVVVLPLVFFTYFSGRETRLGKTFYAKKREWFLEEKTTVGGIGLSARSTISIDTKRRGESSESASGNAGTCSRVRTFYLHYGGGGKCCHQLGKFSAMDAIRCYAADWESEEGKKGGETSRGKRHHIIINEAPEEVSHSGQKTSLRRAELWERVDGRAKKNIRVPRRCASP